MSGLVAWGEASGGVASAGAVGAVWGLCGLVVTGAVGRLEWEVRVRRVSADFRASDFFMQVISYRLPLRLSKAWRE